MVGESKHVLAADESRGEFDQCVGQIRIVVVTQLDGRGDDLGAIVFGVRQRGRFDVRSDRCVVHIGDGEIERVRSRRSATIIDREIERVGTGLRTIVIVGHAARLNVVLGECFAEIQCGAAEPQRSVGHVGINRVDQLGIRVVDVGRPQLGWGDEIPVGPFSHRRAGVDRQDLFIIDRGDVDTDRAQRLIGAAAAARVAAIIDHDGDRVGVVAVGVGRAVQIRDVRRVIEVRIQFRQRSGQRPSRRRTAEVDVGIGGQRQPAAGRCRQRHRQIARSSIDITEVDRRQIDRRGDVFGHRHIARQ